MKRGVALGVALALVVLGCAGPRNDATPPAPRQDKGVAGAGVRTSMDALAEALTRIPGASLERPEEDTLLLHFDAEALFGPDNASLTSAGAERVDDVAEVLMGYGNTAVLVQGGTGADPQLSAWRAASIKSGLIEYGLAPEGLAAVGGQPPGGRITLLVKTKRARAEASRVKGKRRL